MFCKTCGLGIDENIMYCPGCGSKLDRNSLALNPLPGYVVHSNNEDTTDTDAEPEVIVIDNSEATNNDSSESVASVQLNSFSEENENTNAKEQTAQQIKSSSDSSSNAPFSNQNIMSGANKSQNDSELQATISDTKRNTHKVLLIIICLIFVAAIVNVIVRAKIYLNKSSSDSNTTEFTSTPIDIASATDTTLNNLALEEDNFIISKSITIAGQEYDSKDLQHFTDKTTGVSVTLYKIELNATDIQTYCDEQESAYQLQSAEIHDVAYVGDMYRYHYAQGYYQYGLAYQNSLVIYEISDNIDTELCNEMAIDYFKTEGVIK